LSSEILINRSVTWDFDCTTRLPDHGSGLKLNWLLKFP